MFLYVSSREVQECVPSQFYSKQGSQQWLNMVTQHMQYVQPLNPHQARAQFLGKTLLMCPTFLTLRWMPKRQLYVDRLLYCWLFLLRSETNSIGWNVHQIDFFYKWINIIFYVAGCIKRFVCVFLFRSGQCLPHVWLLFLLHTEFELFIYPGALHPGCEPERTALS